MVFDATGNKGNRNVIRPLKNAKRQLAHQRLTVGRTLTCYNKRSPSKLLFKTDGIQQQVNPGTAIGIHVLQECVAQSSCSPSTRYILLVVAKAQGRLLGKSPRTLVKFNNHLGCSPFLWSKHVSSSILTTKRIPNIGGNCETDILQYMYIAPRALRGKAICNGSEHPDAAVACGASAQPHDDVSASFTYGICHDLACPVACCHHRVAFLGAEESQSAGFCHLNNSGISIYEILCHNWPH